MHARTRILENNGGSNVKLNTCHVTMYSTFDTNVDIYANPNT